MQVKRDRRRAGLAGRQAGRLHGPRGGHGRRQERVPDAHPSRQRRRQRAAATHAGRQVVRRSAVVARRQTGSRSCPAARARRTSGSSGRTAARPSSSPTSRPASRSFKWSPDGKLHRLHRARSARRRTRRRRQGEERRPRRRREHQDEPAVRRSRSRSRQRQARSRAADDGQLQRRRRSIGRPGRLRLVARRQDDRLHAHAHAAARRLADRRPVARRRRQRRRSRRWLTTGRGRVVAALLARRPVDRLRRQRRSADLGRHRHASRWSPPPAGRRARWPTPPTASAATRSWSAGPPTASKLYFTEVQRHASAAAARCRSTARRSEISHGATACRSSGVASERDAHARSASAGRRSTRPPEAYVSRGRTLRAGAGQPRQRATCRDLPLGRTEVDPLEIDRRPGDRRPADLPGRLREGQALSAAARDPRRADGRLHAELRRHAGPVSRSRRSPRGATPSCGPTPRQQRLRQEVPLRQLRRLGRRRLTRT